MEKTLKERKKLKEAIKGDQWQEKWTLVKLQVFLWVKNVSDNLYRDCVYMATYVYVNTCYCVFQPYIIVKHYMHSFIAMCTHRRIMSNILCVLCVNIASYVPRLLECVAYFI